MVEHVGDNELDLIVVQPDLFELQVFLEKLLGDFHQTVAVEGYVPQLGLLLEDKFVQTLDFVLAEPNFFDASEFDENFGVQALDAGSRRDSTL